MDFGTGFLQDCIIVRPSLPLLESYMVCTIGYINTESTKIIYIGRYQNIYFITYLLWQKSDTLAAVGPPSGAAMGQQRGLSRTRSLRQCELLQARPELVVNLLRVLSVSVSVMSTLILGL